MPEAWSIALADARKACGLSRDQLAAASAVSRSAIKAYELGVRHPSRPLLVALLDALKLERIARNQILEDAGFAAAGDLLHPANVDYEYSLPEAIERLASLPWPAHVNDEMMDVVAANDLMQRVWGVDLTREFNQPIERNMISFISHPRFAAQLVNWDEAVGVGVSVMKGHHRGGASQPEATNPYFAAVVQKFLSGDPEYVRRFLNLWETVPIHVPRLRWDYPVRWQHPKAGPLSFQVNVTVLNSDQGFALNEWVPVDARTWSALESIRA